MNFDKIFGVTPQTSAPVNEDISGKDTSKSGLGFDALPEGTLPSDRAIEEDTEYMGAERVRNIVPAPLRGYVDKNAPFPISEMGGVYDPLTKTVTDTDPDTVFPNSIEQQRINKEGYDKRIRALVENEPVIISDINQLVGPATETETSQIISSKSGLEQSLFGLADNEKEFVEVLNQKLGENNFRYKFDKDAGLLEPKYYVSVKREDGTFTPYSTVTKTFTDGLARASINLAYEAGASVAVFAGATAVAAKVGIALPVLGLVVAPLTLAYLLYTGGKGKEAFRQFIKESIDIKDDDLNDAMDYLDKIGTVLTPGAGTSMEELSGILETLPLVGRIKSSLKLMKDGVSKKLNTYAKQQATPGNYESAIKSIDTVKQTQVGGDLDVGIPLESLILSQVKDNVIIRRVASLAAQTTAVIPGRVREQMQSAVNYITKYKDNIGAGDFGRFRELVNNLGTFYQSTKNAATEIDYRKAGTSLIELTNIFKFLRAREAEGLYNKVFDKTKDVTYNLDGIRKLIPVIGKDIIPTTQAGKKGIKGDVLPEMSGESAFNNLTRILLKLGKVVDNKGNLNRQQITAAINDFKKLYPGEAADFDKIGNNPGRVLLLFASRYGKMAREIYREGLKTANPTLLQASMDLRKGLMDLIGNPNQKVPGLAQDLKIANSHYNETFELTGTELQVTMREGAKPKLTGTKEPGETTTALIGSKGPSSAGPSVSPTVTLENMGQIEDYVRKELGKLDGPQLIEAIKKGTAKGRKGVAKVTEDDILGMKNLQEMFRKVLNDKIVGISQRYADSTQADDALLKYLDSFDKPALRKLGITETDELELRAASRTITELNRGGFRDLIGANLDSDTAFGQIFTTILQNPKEMTTTLRKMLDVTKTAANPKEEVENLRKGLLESIFSLDTSGGGILKLVTENSPTARVGTLSIDANKFMNFNSLLQTTPIFKQILTKQDLKVLDGLSTYVATVQKAGTDAGSALSGAQLIGNMFTLDFFKFASGFARLSAQKRISELFTNQTFVDLVSGMGSMKELTKGQKFREILFGKGAIGQGVATVALNIEREKTQQPAIDQTNKMLKKPTMDFDSIYGVTP
jgi:hypothetical protein